MRHRIISLAFLMFFFLVGFTSAYEPHETNLNYTYAETVANADSCNITAITYPDGTTADLDIAMGKSGFRFTTLILSGNFTQVGETCWGVVCYDSDADPQYVSDDKCLTVTPNGDNEITEGKSNIITIALAIMVIISFFFMFLGARIEGWAWKIILFGTASVLLLMCVLYSMVLIDQNLAGAADIVNGYATFWMVIKVITGIAILSLLLLAGYRAFKLWEIKRGFRDD